MSIHIGTSTKNQQEITIGDKQMGEVYVGDKLVWQKSTGLSDLLRRAVAIKEDSLGRLCILYEEYELVDDNIVTVGVYAKRFLTDGTVDDTYLTRFFGPYGTYMFGTAGTYFPSSRFGIFFDSSGQPVYILPPVAGTSMFRKASNNVYNITLTNTGSTLLCGTSLDVGSAVLATSTGSTGYLTFTGISNLSSSTGYYLPSTIAQRVRKGLYHQVGETLSRRVDWVYLCDETTVPNRLYKFSASAPAYSTYKQQVFRNTGVPAQGTVPPGISPTELFETSSNDIYFISLSPGSPILKYTSDLVPIPLTHSLPESFISGDKYCVDMFNDKLIYTGGFPEKVVRLNTDLSIDSSFNFPEHLQNFVLLEHDYSKYAGTQVYCGRSGKIYMYNTYISFPKGRPKELLDIVVLNPNGTLSHRISLT